MGFRGGSLDIVDQSLSAGQEKPGKTEKNQQSKSV